MKLYGGRRIYEKINFLLAGIICLCGTFFGCSNSHNREEPNDDLPIQNSISSTEENFVIDNTFVAESESQPENSNTVNAETLADIFGISILFPKNSTWIADNEYYLVWSTHMSHSTKDFKKETIFSLRLSETGLTMIQRSSSG